MDAIGSSTAPTELRRSSLVERELILNAAGTAERRRSAATQLKRRQLSGVDWARLGATLRQQRLLATLGPRIIETVGGHVDNDFSEAVSEAIIAGRRRGVILQLLSLRAISMLADVGISSSALKGPLLGEAIYGDPGRRPSSDVDLLVSPEKLGEAVQVLRGLGYGQPADYVYDHGLPLLHFALAHEAGKLPPIELHWRIHWYEGDFANQRLLAPAGVPADGWRPAPADELAALLLFYARDGFVGLRLASDLSAWWDVYGDKFPPGGLGDLIGAYPALGRVIPASAAVAETIVGLPAENLLGEQPRLGFRGRAAAKLANPHPRSSRAQLYADIGLIDGLLMPPGGLRGFIRRNVLLPREVLDQQARHADRLRPRSQLSRSVGIVARYAFTLTRLLRPTCTIR